MPSVPATVGEIEDEIRIEREERELAKVDKEKLIQAIEEAHKAIKQPPVTDFILKAAVLEKFQETYREDIADVVGAIQADLQRLAEIVGVEAETA